MGTKLDSSSAYHPQTDGQTERVNQIMEDMLRACVLTYGKDWEQSQWLEMKNKEISMKHRCNFMLL